MSSLSFRTATVDDVEALVRLRLAFLEEINRRPVPPALEHELRRYFLEKLPAGAFVAHLALAAGAIVATSGLAIIERPPSFLNLNGREGYIMNMYTLPPWRGQGIAGRLLDGVIESARAKGCLRVALHAEPLARPLYERAGFAPSGNEMVRAL